MTKPSVSTKAVLTALLLLVPALAQAHPGHGASSFTGGIAHPVLGLDHLLAMVAVGLWAMQLGGRALWAVPCAFVAAMLGGGALALAGVHIPFLEQGILASVFILGLLIVMAARLPLAASVAIVGIFAILHGFAHGAEMPAGASSLAYGAGFALATAALHACGMAAGLVLTRAAQSMPIRVAGAAVITGGLFIALS